MTATQHQMFASLTFNQITELVCTMERARKATGNRAMRAEFCAVIDDAYTAWSPTERAVQRVMQEM